MKASQLRRIASAVVAATQEKLPPEIRELARAVPVLLEDGPDASVLAEGLPANLLGLFTGTPHGEEIGELAPEPAYIILYLNNLWDYADRDETLFRAEARLTYLHELGHHLGWNEDQLAARGLD